MTEPERAVPRAPAPARVAILGAGPVGLDAALLAADAGWPFTVYESAPRVGGNLRRWGHVRLFTPWPMNVSARMARHLRAAGYHPPEGDGSYPTGAELADELLEPLARLPAIAGSIAYGTRVAAIGRAGLLKHEEVGTPERAAHPFRLLLHRPDGRAAIATADLVLDCTGTYATPNATGDGGVPAPGEEELGDRLVRWLPDLARDREAWAGRRILLVGAGWSAQTAARDLAVWLPSAPGTRVLWVVRRMRSGWGEVPGDPFPGRQALADSSKSLAAGLVPGLQVEFGTVVDAVKPDGRQVLVRLRGANGREVLVDRVLSLTGYVPDAALYRQLHVHECYATSAPMGLSAQLLGAAAGNCLDQPAGGVDALRNPEPNFFILGAKSYGRNSEFLMRTGYAQVSDIAAAYGPGLGSARGAEQDGSPVQATATCDPRSAWL